MDWTSCSTMLRGSAMNPMFAPKASASRRTRPRRRGGPRARRSVAEPALREVLRIDVDGRLHEGEVAAFEHLAPAVGGVAPRHELGEHLRRANEDIGGQGRGAHGLLDRSVAA